MESLGTMFLIPPRHMTTPRPQLRLVVLIAALVAASAARPAAASAQGISTAPRALRLARVFGDGMVLQRGARIPVWGWAQPGATVTVTLGTQTARATANGVPADRIITTWPLERLRGWLAKS